MEIQKCHQPTAAFKNHLLEVWSKGGCKEIPDVTNAVEVASVSFRSLSVSEQVRFRYAYSEPGVPHLNGWDRSDIGLTVLGLLLELGTVDIHFLRFNSIYPQPVLHLSREVQWCSHCRRLTLTVENFANELFSEFMFRLIGHSQFAGRIRIEVKKQTHDFYLLEAYGGEGALLYCDPGSLGLVGLGEP